MLSLCSHIWCTCETPGVPHPFTQGSLQLLASFGQSAYACAHPARMSMRWATQSYQHRLYCGSHMHASFISITRKSAGRDEGPPCCAAGAKDTSEAKECRRTATHGWAAEAVLLKVHVALPAGRLPRQSLLGHSGIVSLIHAFASTMHSCMHVIVAAAVTKIMKLQCSSCMTHFNFQAFRMPECQARTKAGRCFYRSYAALPLQWSRLATRGLLA